MGDCLRAGTAFARPVSISSNFLFLFIGNSFLCLLHFLLTMTVTVSLWKKGDYVLAFVFVDNACVCFPLDTQNFITNYGHLIKIVV